MSWRAERGAAQPARSRRQHGQQLRFGCAPAAGLRRRRPCPGRAPARRPCVVELVGAAEFAQRVVRLADRLGLLAALRCLRRCMIANSLVLLRCRSGADACSGDAARSGMSGPGAPGPCPRNVGRHRGRPCRTGPSPGPPGHAGQALPVVAGAGLAAAAKRRALPGDAGAAQVPGRRRAPRRAAAAEWLASFHGRHPFSSETAIVGCLALKRCWRRVKRRKEPRRHGPPAALR